MRTPILTTQRRTSFNFLMLLTSLCIFAAGSVSALAQTLQLRYTFEDSGTTTTSDPSGALSVSLNLLNSAGAATDLHSGANGGVQNQGHSLDLSSGANSGTAANSVINGPIAQTLNNAALGALGVVSNFTMAIWFKQDTSLTNTANRGGRIIIMGTNNVVDNNATNNDVQLHFQTTNVLYARINNSILSSPIYYNPLQSNIWLFAAITYDGTNNARFYFGTEASPAKMIGIRSIGAQTIDFGSGGGTANLLLGNRSADRARCFDGWLDEFRFYTGDGDATFIENLRQASTPVVVTGLYPDGMSLLQGTNTLNFTASSASGVSTGNIKVAVNDTDVSSSLIFGGSSTSRTVSYTNLPVNNTLLNNAPLNIAKLNIKVTDDGGITTSNIVYYDNFSPTNFIWETEDFDYATDPINGPGAQFIDNPRYAFEAASDTYWQRQGQPPVDYFDNAGGAQSDAYRGPFDLAATEFSIGNGVNGGPSVSDLMRGKVLDAYALNNAVREVDVGFFDTGNWMNYTRTYPAGAFNVYLRMAYGGNTVANSSLEEVTAGVGTPTQTTNTLGAFSSANSGGWQSYTWAPLRDGQGNLVRLDLGGVKTLRLTARANGGGNVNFLMLTPANTNLPVLSGIYPNGTNMFQPSPTFSFTATSPIGVTINPSSIKVTLTTTTILSTTTTNLTSTSGLTITGSASSKNVGFVLASNATFTAVVNVTDANGSPASATVRFDTYNPIFTWEAEDYDYNGGQTVAGAQTNGYATFVGTTDIDYHDNVVASQNGTPVYRTGDPVGLENNGDGPPRLQYIGSGFTDYDVGWYDNGNWNNYTRTFPAGQFNVYLRAANGSAGVGSLALARVTSGQQTTTQTTTNLGSFSIPVTGGWQTYTWIPMRDGNGNLVQFSGGGVQTIRATSSGGLNANFYALFPANTNLPIISGVYPNGASLFQKTNKLSFSVTSSAGVSTNSIIVTLDGVQLTNLVFTGSAVAWNVSYVGLPPNSPHAVTIAATDSNGNSASTSVSFDTFSASYFQWEAEDYDYNSGQYFDNPQVGSYSNLSATADVDFHDQNTGGNYLYRPTGTATEVTADQPRAQFAGAFDFNIGFYAVNEWGNYTRHYPAGNYNVWGRFAAGGGDTTAFLGRVDSGWGTITQTTNFLGTFSIANSGWGTFTWVPLRDDGGNLVKVSFDGSTNTLKLAHAPTGPDVNVNFFMLTPALAPNTISAALSGANVNISFPTQSGLSYQVEYKNNITDVGWTPLGSPVSGDGTIKFVADPATGSRRFYHVRIQ